VTSQTSFHSGLLAPSAPVPEGLTDGHDHPAGRRYGVYRNNVTVALRQALADGFPAIVGLIGRENFDHLARGFLRQAPPRSPVMSQYGSAFPDFLASVEQLAQLPYLGDVARIDLAMRQSYHAADSTGIDPAVLQALDEPTLLTTRIDLAPSLRVIRSRWPIGAIWHYTLRGADKPSGGPQDVAVLRAEYDPEPVILGPGATEVLAAFQDGKPFGAAIAAGGAAFDLARLLTLLLAQNAITALRPSSSVS